MQILQAQKSAVASRPSQAMSNFCSCKIVEPKGSHHILSHRHIRKNPHWVIEAFGLSSLAVPGITEETPLINCIGNIQATRGIVKYILVFDLQGCKECRFCRRKNLRSLRDHRKRCPIFAPAKLSNRRVLITYSLTAIYEKTRITRVLSYMAVREGFEPSLGVNLNTLSRRAPSASSAISPINLFYPTN